MEYSSTKKARLPGISFDFDSESDDGSSLVSDDGCGDVGVEAGGSATPPSDHGGDGERPTPAATPSSPSRRLFGRRSSSESSKKRPLDNNSTPANNKINSTNKMNSTPANKINKKSASKKSTKRGPKRSDSNLSKGLSPTTLRLHETADKLVESAPESALDKVDGAVANVVDSVVGLFAFGRTPSKNDGENIGNTNDGENAGSKNDDGGISVLENCSRSSSAVARGAPGNDKDGSTPGQFSSELAVEGEGKSGDKPEVLDAAAAYLARMEMQYSSKNDNENAEPDGGVSRVGSKADLAGEVDSAGRGRAESEDSASIDGDTAESQLNGDCDAGEGNGIIPKDGCSVSGEIRQEDDLSGNASAASSSPENDHDVQQKWQRQLNVDMTANGQVEEGGAAAEVESHSNNSELQSHSVSSELEEDVDNAGDVEESFYIGENEGFRTSLSVHESDISETASEDEEDDGEEVIENEEEESLEEEDGLDEDLHTEGGDRQQVGPGDVVDGRGAGESEMPDCALDRIGADSAAAGERSLHSNDRTSADADPLPREEQQQEPATPTPLAAPGTPSDTPNDAHEDEDFVPSTLKRILSAQESELERMLSSIDALTSTPARIARECDEELLRGEDRDASGGLPKFDSVVRRGMGSGLRADRGVGNCGRPDGDEGVSPDGKGGLRQVKKRLILEDGDGGAPDDEPSSNRENQELMPLPQSPAVEEGPRTTLVASTSTIAAAPNRPELTSSLPPEECPGIESTELVSHAEVGAASASTATGIQTGGKDVADDVSKDAVGDSAAGEEEIHDPPDAVGENSGGEDRDDPPEGAGDKVPSTALPEPSGGIGLAKDLADEPAAGGYEPEGAAEGAAVDDSHLEEDDEEEGIPDSIRRLFRDADSVLRDVLSSPSPTRRGNNVRLDGEGTYCDDYVMPEAEAPPVQAKTQSDEAERGLDCEEALLRKRREEEEARLLAGVEKAEAERAEREGLAEEEERLPAEAEKAEAEEESLERERAERERALAKQRQDEEEARLLAEAEKAKAKRAEKERLAAEKARRAQEERLERERAEHERALAKQRQDEEEARLLAEAEKTKAKRAERERLAAEKARRAQEERLERERAEHERALAKQRQEEEEARLLAEAEKAEAERVERDRLAAEASRQAEEERLERERAERKRTLARQRQEEEDAHLKAQAEAERFEREEKERVEREKALAEKPREKEEASQLAAANEAKSDRPKERVEPECSPINNDNDKVHPALDSLRGAFLAAESKLESAEATPSIHFDNEHNAGDKDNKMNLDRILAPLSFEDGAVDAQNNGGDSSLANDTFDTAFCSLGGIERATDDFFDAKEEIEDGNGADADAIADEVNEQAVVSAINGDGNDVVEAKESLVKDLQFEQRRGVTSHGSSTAEKRCETPKISNAVAEVQANQTEAEVRNETRKSAAATMLGLEEKKIDDAPQNVNEALTGSLEQLTLTGDNQENPVEGKIDILDRVDSYINNIERGLNLAEKPTSVESNELPSCGAGTVATDESSADVISGSEQSDGVCLEQNKDLSAMEVESRPSTGNASAGSGRSNSGVSDENTMNESMFMPNMSLDITSASPEEALPAATAEPLMLPMSEDESESEEDDDYDEAFFPNRDLAKKSRSAMSATKPKRSAPKVSKARASLSHVPLRARPSSIATSNSASENPPKSRALANARSTPSTSRSTASRSSVTSSSSRSNPNRSTTTTLPKRGAAEKTIHAKLSSRAQPPSAATRSATSRAKRVASSVLSSPPCIDRPRKVSAATLKRRSRLSSTAKSTSAVDRKAAPRPSPPSNVKPAKKRSKLAPAPDSPPEKVLEEEADKSLSLVDMSLNITVENSTTVVSPRSQATDQRGEATSSLPSQASQPSIRQMRVDLVKPTVVTRGKENNKVEGSVSRGKPKAVENASKSMKQSLVSMSRSRRQSETNLQAPSRRKEPKRTTVDIKRLERLSQPRRQSMARPSERSPSAKSTKKKATAPKTSGPPSFLSRTVPARPPAKSSAELEEEEMERIRRQGPFRAKRIPGSSAEVKSRFMTARPRPAPTQTSSPSVALAKTAALAAAKPPSFLSRESGIYKPTPVRKKVHTFGESVQRYLSHGLRDTLPSPNRKTSSASLSMPPSLLNRRALSANMPSSSEEIEMEECRKQFRARPLPVVTRQSHARGESQRETPRTLTTPSPFRLRTTLRGDTRPPPPSADDIELAKPFRAIRRFNGNIEAPYHVRAQREHELAKERRERLARDVEDGHSCEFRAKPVPKTTYEARPVEMSMARARPLTQPRPPRLSLVGRAEERKLFDKQAEESRNADNAMKLMQEQRQKEVEEEEIQRQRRSYAGNGGFCFKANDVKITYQ